MKIVIVTGGRDFEGWPLVHSALNDAAPDLVITGGCNCKPGDPYLGADRFARNWCERFGAADYAEFPALWVARGKSAGPKRNAMMARIAKMLAASERGRTAPVQVEVFAFPGGDGTEDMVKQAATRGLHVRRFK